MQINLSNHKNRKDIPERVFYHIKGKQPGATIVFFAGIHGNEFAGVNALNEVLPTLNSDEICGEIIGVYGNIKALKENKRFIDTVFGF